MQDQQTLKQNRKWTASKVVFVIGSIVLLMAAAYMAYVAIDEQARPASLATEGFQALR